MDPLTIRWALGTALACLLCVWLAVRWGQWRRSVVAIRRAARAGAGEDDALPLLRDAGYEIIGTQVPVAWALECDGVRMPVPLRVDVVVRRDHRTYVAEVKTGEAAPLLTNSSTRRQLLEYRIASGADGILLVDVERGAIHEITFPSPN